MKTARPTILIIDDIPLNIQVLSGFLKDEYRIKVATNGKLAIDIVADSGKEIDLILLDVNMPDMDGYQVCKAIKANESVNHIPIIFVTAKNEVIDEEIGFSLGAVDYITKPFHPTIVKMRVRNQVSLKLKTDLLAELAMQDGLMQIPNRRYFDEIAPRIYNSCIQTNKEFAIVMIDIDNFKSYNDSYGHGLGDFCLIQVAEALKYLVNESQFVARYGGEEFVVVVPGKSIEEVLEWSNLAVKAISGLSINHNASNVASHVTISAGVSFIDSSNTQTEDVYDVLNNADKALYQAKSLGRNQVVLFKQSF